jgi:superfamily I DNA/RNA helicase
VERLLDGRGGVQMYDELIVDEAQDLLRRSYLDFLDLSLVGGLSTGRWRAFGDFARQSIYESANLTLDGLKASSRTVAVYSLRRNCRNTPRIADLAHFLGGLSPRYSAILRPDDRQDPEVQYYRSDGDQRALLVAALERLSKEGYSGDEITVLSPLGVNACAASVTEVPWRDRLAPSDRASRGQVRYGTLQSFKGMEAPAVIVTDIESVGDQAAADLFYVGVTRALHRLTVLAHDKARAGVLERLAAAVQDTAA